MADVELITSRHAGDLQTKEEGWCCHHDHRPPRDSHTTTQGFRVGRLCYTLSTNNGCVFVKCHDWSFHVTQSYPDSGTNLSQLWTRKIILKSVLGRDMLVPKPRIVWKDSHLVNHPSNTCNLDLVRQFLLLSTVQNKWNKIHLEVSWGGYKLPGP